MEWISITLTIISLIVGVIGGLLFKPPKPPDVEDKTMEIPSTEIGETIGVLFGRRLLIKPHVVWWGNLKIIKEEVDTGGKK